MIIVNGDARRIPLPDGSVHCCISSPPYYGLRNYGVPGQIGLEATPDEFVSAMVRVFREVRRVMRDDGTLFLNLGDSYVGSGMTGGTNSKDGGEARVTRMFRGNRRDTVPGLKPKDLIGIPWRVAFALQADGWWLRSEITWCKTSPMPESVTDRPTSATEKLFLFAKSERYFYDQEAVRVPSSKATVERDRYSRITSGKDGAYSVQHDHETPRNPAGRNLWNYWVLGAESFHGAHFATYPSKLVEPCVKAGTSERGCCPTCGAPWVRVVERKTLGVGYTDHTEDLTKGMSAYAPQTRKMNGRILAKFRAKNPGTESWSHSCSCPARDPIPCTVLDPFSGAGTTGVVATGLGRRYVGVELNPEYARMSAHRISRPHASKRGRDDSPLLLFAE